MAVKKLEKKQGVGSVEVQYKGEEPVETQEVVSETITDSALANVGVTMSYTKNLGNYESAKIQVALHLPCTVEAIDQNFDTAQSWVDQKLTKILEEMETEQGG